MYYDLQSKERIPKEVVTRDHDNKHLSCMFCIQTPPIEVLDEVLSSEKLWRSLNLHVVHH